MKKGGNTIKNQAEVMKMKKTINHVRLHVSEGTYGQYPRQRADYPKGFTEREDFYEIRDFQWIARVCKKTLVVFIKGINETDFVKCPYRYAVVY
ncbi:MAG: hypothetical protein FWC70_05510 [Defluviitaleaceae bacterium]|nr:hypothetical protein [Defluviitaleaceae bacterium]